MPQAPRRQAGQRRLLRAPMANLASGLESATCATLVMMCAWTVSPSAASGSERPGVSSTTTRRPSSVVTSAEWHCIVTAAAERRAVKREPPHSVFAVLLLPTPRFPHSTSTSGWDAAITTCSEESKGPSDCMGAVGFVAVLHLFFL